MTGDVTSNFASGGEPGQSRHGGTAVGSVRSGVTAAVALAGASVIAVAPVAPPPFENHVTSFENHVASLEVRLAADSSILNIPFNLIQDIINIPYNEVQGINTLGQSLLFTGTWLLASSTNVWGTDPADLAHYYGLAGLIPFPAFSNAFARLADHWAGGDPAADQLRLQQRRLPELGRAAQVVMSPARFLGAVDDRQIHL